MSHILATVTFTNDGRVIYSTAQYALIAHASLWKLCIFKVTLYLSPRDLFAIAEVSCDYHNDM